MCKLFYLCAVTAFCGSVVLADAQAAPTTSPATQPVTAADVAARAKEIFEGLEDRRLNGEALTPSYLELYYTWSRRWAEFERMAATTDTDRLAAMNRHLQRMKRIQRMIAGMLDKLSRIQDDQANYYVTEAEFWIAQMTKK